MSCRETVGCSTALHAKFMIFDMQEVEATLLKVEAALPEIKTALLKIETALPESPILAHKVEQLSTK